MGYVNKVNIAPASSHRNPVFVVVAVFLFPLVFTNRVILSYFFFIALFVCCLLTVQSIKMAAFLIVIRLLAGKFDGRRWRTNLHLDHVLRTA